MKKFPVEPGDVVTWVSLNVAEFDYVNVYVLDSKTGTKRWERISPASESIATVLSVHEKRPDRGCDKFDTDCICVVELLVPGMPGRWCAEIDGLGRDEDTTNACQVVSLT